MEKEETQNKRSIRFLIGVGLIIISFLMAWPMITLLGLVATFFNQPKIFTHGSPVTYGLSYLVQILGMYLAGKEGLIWLKKRLAKYRKKT